MSALNLRSLVCFTVAMIQFVHLLFWTYNLPLDALFVVRSPTRGAQAIHISLDVVVTELTDLR